MQDEYLETCETARVALYDVIMLTEPGTGWELHQAYVSLKNSIAKHAKPTPAPAEPTVTRLPEWNKHFTVVERERQVMGALTEHRLTIRELSEHIRETHPGIALYDSYIGNIVKRLWKSQELDRQAETFNKSHIRYRYFRRTTLEGPIADLEEVLADTGGENRSSEG